MRDSRRDGASFYLSMARTGKIARLPQSIRAELNLRLRDGVPASKLIPWLHGQEAVLRVLDEEFNEEPISPQNLTEWRQGGYQDWLRQIEKLEARREQQEYFLNLAALGKNTMDASASIVAGEMMTLFEDIDIQQQKLLIAENPENLIDFIGALAKLQSVAVKNRTVDQNDKKLSQNDRRLNIEERRAQDQTIKSFMTWFADEKAREIMAGKGERKIKMEDLRNLFFGQKPEGIA